MAKKKDKLKCQTCANQVNGFHCTMQKTMQIQSYKYKKCEGYQKYVPPPPPIVKKKVEKPIDYEALGDFGRFLQTGGHYSIKTGKYNDFS